MTTTELIHNKRGEKIWLVDVCCSVGQVLTRFCSDSYEFRDIQSSLLFIDLRTCFQVHLSIESRSTNSLIDPSNENAVRMKFSDLYEEETCQRNGQCSSDEQTFQILE